MPNSFSRYAAALCIGLLLTRPGLGQEPDAETLINQGVAHHDKGEYAEAIRAYESALDIEPRNLMAAYELAYSHNAATDYASCATAAARGIENANPDQPQIQVESGLYMIRAICYSNAGQLDEAAAAFNSGIERFPEDFGLRLNAAVTMARADRPAEARDQLLTAMRLDPRHPSPYYLYGNLMRELDERPLALLSYATFLQLEFNTPRTREASASLLNSLYAPRNDAPAPAIVTTVEAGFSSGTPMLQMAYYTAEVPVTEDNAVAPPVDENVSKSLQTYLDLAAKVPFDGDEAFISELLQPRVSRLAEAGVTEPFAWFVLAVAGMDGGSEWLDAHPDEWTKLEAVLRSQ